MFLLILFSEKSGIEPLLLEDAGEVSEIKRDHESVDGNHTMILPITGGDDDSQDLFRLAFKIHENSVYGSAMKQMIVDLIVQVVNGNPSLIHATFHKHRKYAVEQRRRELAMKC